MIVGTGMQPKLLLAMGKMVAAVQNVVCGSRHPSGLLNALSFGSYNKKIGNARTVMDWLPKDLPVLFIAGAEDPVGGYGKGVQKAYRSFQDIGMKNVRMKLYEGDRHELLNESDRKQVYEDIYQWVMSIL